MAIPSREVQVERALRPVYRSAEIRGNLARWLAGCSEEERAGIASALLDEAGSTAPNGVAAEEERTVELVTLRAILEDPAALEPPEPLAERIAYRGYHTLLASREKCGKSTFMSATAAAVSRGSRFLGVRAERAPVLYVTLDESPKDTARRLKAFGADPDRVHLLRRLSAPTDPLGDLEAAIKATGPAFVGVDTLAEFVRGLGPDSGDAQAWTAIISGLTRLARDYEAAVVTNHHTQKAKHEYRDSGAIGASVDLILTMKRAATDASVRRVEALGRIPVESYALRLRGDPHDPEDGAPRYELASGEIPLDARLVLFVEHNAGCSKRAIREGVSGRGTDIDAALRRLEKRGTIKVDRRGQAHAFRTVSATVSRPPEKHPPGHGSGHGQNEGTVSEEKPLGHATDTVRTRSRGTVPDSLRAPGERDPVGHATRAHESAGHADGRLVELDSCECGAPIAATEDRCTACREVASLNLDTAPDEATDEGDGEEELRV